MSMLWHELSIERCHSALTRHISILDGSPKMVRVVIHSYTHSYSGYVTPTSPSLFHTFDISVLKDLAFVTYICLPIMAYCRHNPISMSGSGSQTRMYQRMLFRALIISWNETLHFVWNHAKNVTTLVTMLGEFHEVVKYLKMQSDPSIPDNLILPWYHTRKRYMQYSGIHCDSYL